MASLEEFIKGFILFREREQKKIFFVNFNFILKPTQIIPLTSLRTTATLFIKDIN